VPGGLISSGTFPFLLALPSRAAVGRAPRPRSGRRRTRAAGRGIDRCGSAGPSFRGQTRDTREVIGCAGSATRRTCPPPGDPPRRHRRPAGGSRNARRSKERMDARHGRLRVRRDRGLRHDRGDGLEAQVSRSMGELGSPRRSGLPSSPAEPVGAVRPDRRSYLALGSAPATNASHGRCAVPLPTSMLREHACKEVIGCGPRVTGATDSPESLGRRGRTQPAPGGSRRSRRARKERIDAQSDLRLGEPGRPGLGRRRRLEARVVSQQDPLYREALRVTGGLSASAARSIGAARG